MLGGCSAAEAERKKGAPKTRSRMRSRTVNRTRVSNITGLTAVSAADNQYGETEKRKRGGRWFWNGGRLKRFGIRPVLADYADVESVDNHIPVNIGQRMRLPPMCNHILDIKLVDDAIRVDVAHQCWGGGCLEQQLRSQGLITHLEHTSFV